MKILDRLPILPRKQISHFRQHHTVFHRNALVVWISVGLRGEKDPSRISAPFPAMLDSGNNSEAYFHLSHLLHWAETVPARLNVVGNKRLNRRDIPLHAADLWIHPNRPGSYERLVGGAPFRLDVAEGIAVAPHQRDRSDFPRVPLVGFAALRCNQLDYWLDSQTGHSFLHTADWRSRLVRCLYRYF